MGGAGRGRPIFPPRLNHADPVRFSALKETKTREYLIRFALGGLATAITGWIAKRYGPETGGLFLGLSSDLLSQRHPDRKT